MMLAIVDPERFPGSFFLLPIPAGIVAGLISLVTVRGDATSKLISFTGMTGLGILLVTASWMAVLVISGP